MPRTRQGNPKVGNFPYRSGDIAFDPANPGVFVASAGNVWYLYDLNTNTSTILTETPETTTNHVQLAYGSNGVLYGVEATTGQFYTVVYDAVAKTVTLTANWAATGYTFTDLASGPQCQ